MADQGVHRGGITGHAHLLILEMDVIDAILILAKHLGHIESRLRDPAYIEADANTRISFGENLFNDLRIAIGRADAMIMDGKPDVVFLDQRFKAIPVRRCRLDDDELRANETSEL